MRSEAEIRAALKHSENMLKEMPHSEAALVWRAQIACFKWVLNDPAPINRGDSESKPEASGG